MIKNLEEFKALDVRDNIYTFEFNYVEEIPDEMPKFAADIFYPNFPFDNTSFEQSFLGTSKEFVLKEFYNRQGLYAFVSWRWVNPLVEWLGNRKCLEVMAGRGWLSYALRQKGVDVIATDDYSWTYDLGWDKPLTEVIEMSAVQSAEKFGSEIDVLIMGWPPYGDSVAYETMKKLYEVNPHALVIFIGEMGGCTADDSFYEHFQYAEDEQFYKTVSSKYQSFSGVRDRIYLGKYAKEESHEQTDHI
ncbi:hypothetical protein ACPA0F_18465 [Solibacillus silvestris]